MITRGLVTRVSIALVDERLTWRLGGEVEVINDVGDVSDPILALSVLTLDFGGFWLV
jgi:hypothetical protein